MSLRRAALTAAVPVLLVLVVPARLPAIFVRTESQIVPVERLVANLEREIKAAPKNVQALLNLARVHAMAFALKVEELPAQQSEANVEVAFYPPGASRVPDVVRPAKTPEQQSAADRHLKEATRHYEAAVALDPRNITARLGHGWVLQQSGDKAKAIDEYRRVIELAWPTEEKIKALGVGQRLYTQEAAGYLIALLDPVRDADEIRDLKAKQDAIKARPRAITPIAVPLVDDLLPSAMVDPLARVRFDADGSNLGQGWTWITPDAGWLVYDPDGAGQIRSALQLFGSVTFWLFWENGYHAMRALDDNGDGELSGPELRHLAVWQDRNSNGVSDVGEVRSLNSQGIVALSCRHLAGDGSLVAAFAPQGVRFADGRTRPTYDVILRHSDWTLTRR
jgi:tetratricopeptide (TPR) repeat protein